MKLRILPAALAISGCLGLLPMSTGTALAAPNDVIAAVQVDGYTVSPTITNNSSGRIQCGFVGYIDPTGPGRQDNPNGDFGAGLTVDPGSTLSRPIVDPRYPDQHIPDGNYHVWWQCAPDGTADFRWGTTPPLPAGQATGNPIPITVPSRTKTCIGSVCI
ncbi:hypothetical protein [Nocardia pseudovaccinii]|uniref:hypothetical protein n=1 Tax=Nocardia pseudovaccinii TaxID=189540 RepID=UPI0007A4BE6E|nr:hypothetical protein [Nocardia pseudovaccinii]